MLHYLPRALPSARQSLRPIQNLSCLRLTPIAQQTASISYRPNPLAPKDKPQTASSKIPPASRPLSRDAVPPPTLTTEALNSMPYVVRRTAFAQLPVYRKWMSGGTRQIILIKKVNGDKSVLVNELTEKFGVKEDNIRINPTTGHVELKVCRCCQNSSQGPKIGCG